jgi:hypothetical protein
VGFAFCEPQSFCTKEPPPKYKALGKQCDSGPQIQAGLNTRIEGGWILRRSPVLRAAILAHEGAVRSTVIQVEAPIPPLNCRAHLRRSETLRVHANLQQSSVPARPLVTPDRAINDFGYTILGITALVFDRRRATGEKHHLISSPPMDESSRFEERSSSLRILASASGY